MSQSGRASAQALRNLAAIGVALNTAAVNANRGAATIAPPGPERENLTAAAAGATRAADAWHHTAQAITYLRTADPLNPLIELERMRISQLLAQTTAPTSTTPSLQAGPALTRIAAAYDQVAGWNAHSLRASHESGQLHLAGAGIPRKLASKYPAAAQAKLSNQLVLAPTSVIRRADRAYHSITRARTITPALSHEPPNL
ncbi:MAG: hypothetical protein ACOYEV_19520 [Candidatus Nanopelagicales bacterium]